MKRVLGIETSCDETGVAVVEDGRRILANQVASQVAVHAPYGGVVPELASRQHIQCISQLLDQALDKAPGTVDAVAATCGPGLMGSLLVGVNFARALAFAWQVPYVPVHHLEGHIFSAFLDDGPEAPSQFPLLALLVSGGHTCLIWSRAPHCYEILGATRDDAVGECFDKAARLLELPYPGGPSIQKAAQGGNPEAIAFPRAMTQTDSLDFSYSGLKTAVLYELRDTSAPLADLAASFQAAAIDVLVIKTKRALERTKAERVVVAGGVAANTLLRERLLNELDAHVLLPPISLCVDNGAMIAAAAHSRLTTGPESPFGAIASPNLALA